jgi:hypothetical protein
MKLAGILTYMTMVGSESPKSDKDPQKRIDMLGKHLADWAEQNLCRTDENTPPPGLKCLPAQPIWIERIKSLAGDLNARYDRCGSVPDRSQPQRRRRREIDDADEEDIMDDEEFDMLSDDDVNIFSLAQARYAKDNPVKAVSQLCTAISKWTKDYLQNCRGARARNGGYLRPVLRMAKWKIILNNALIRAQKLDSSLEKSMPSGQWSDWYSRKLAKGGNF